MLTKNQSLTLSCDRLGAELEGVCRYEGMPVFVPGALPGETLEAKVLKAMPQYAFARMMRLCTPSPDRLEPFCPAYAQCGGCSGQHMRYETTLAAKREQVLDNLNRIGGFSLTKADVRPVLSAPEGQRLRNKTSLPVGGTAAQPLLGFYRRRSHDIVPIDACPVAMGDMRGVIAAVRGWMQAAGITPYNEETHQGLLRHVVVRASRSGSLMVLLIATEAALPDTEGLVRRLQENVAGFTSLHVSENRTRGNAILGPSSQKIYGDDALLETLLGLTFELSPLSFFQVNPAQTERLYQTAIDFAALGAGELAVDAYAGVGSIALCMARAAGRVIGLEIVPQAVESARRNALRNGIGNAEFIAAAVEECLPRLVAEGLRPDAIVLDPPRKGVEPQVVQAILAAAPKRVVYISCHVPTQARDAALLAAGGYRIAACQPVDLFCYAGGVENVLLLVKE